MIETIASTYFEFFPGDFILFGVAGALFWMKKTKRRRRF